LFCLTMYPVYARLQALLGPDGALYSYSEDLYLISDPIGMAKALAASPTICTKPGLRIGWGPGKTELKPTSGCDPGIFMPHLEAIGGGLTHLVSSFTSCLGVPRHSEIDPVFNTSLLVSIGIRHDRLLDLVEDVADEDPFAA